jgi:acyl-CoA thioesterase-2
MCFAKLKSVDRSSHKLNPIGPGALDKSIDQHAILDQMSGWLARFDLAVKGEKHRPHDVRKLGVGDHHIEDGLRVFGNLAPDTNGLEQPLCGRGNGGGTHVAGPVLVQRRIRHGDLERIAEPLAQRDGKRQPSEPAAADQHVHAFAKSILRHFCIHHVNSISLHRKPSAIMTTAVQDLLTILDLEPLEVNLFRGRSPQVGWQRVFGGQVIGQALVAATRTVEGRPPHSLHAYFLLAGDPKVPIIYEVDRVRDGKSFTTRRVVAIQHGHAIFVMSVSFHADEDDLDHQAAMPKVPWPEALPSDEETKQRILPQLPEPVRRYYERERPIELRPVEFGRYTGQKPESGRFDIWIRATGRLPNDPAIHRCVLAYASDMMLLDTALLPHQRSLFDRNIMAASLDHALWFHRPFRADEWLLYSQESPNLHGARGFARGLIYAADGTLVASVAQEGLLRQRRDQSAPA